MVCGHGEQHLYDHSCGEYLWGTDALRRCCRTQCPNETHCGQSHALPQQRIRESLGRLQYYESQKGEGGHRERSGPQQSQDIPKLERFGVTARLRGVHPIPHQGNERDAGPFGPKLANVLQQPTRAIGMVAAQRGQTRRGRDHCGEFGTEPDSFGQRHGLCGRT